MASLFARKFDLKRTEGFLNHSLEWRKQRGYLKIPKFSEIDHRIFESSFYLTGSRDKFGRSVRYIRFSPIVPNTGPYTVMEMTKYATWLHYVGVYSDGMDSLRNGCSILCQAEGFGWKNFDFDFQKQVVPLWMENFPLLIRKIFLWNPPAVMSAILKIIYLFLKEKFIERIETGDSKDIVHLVEPQFLIKEFGGLVEWSSDNYVELMKEWVEANEERLIAPGRDT